MADNPRIQELRRRVQKDPASIAFAQLAEEYRRVGSLQEAVEVCRTGLFKHPAYLSARVTLGRALLELEEYDDAGTELETVLRSAPENLAAIRGLAEIYHRRGELEEALKKYQAALGIARHDPDLEESVSQLTRKLKARSSAAAPLEPGAAGTEVPAYGDVAPFGDIVSAAETDVPAGGDEKDSGRPHLQMRQPLPPVLDDAALGAAADEFTRALQALDEIALDLQPTGLPDVPLDLPDLKPSADNQLVPSTDWEIAGFDAAWTKRIEPAPDAVGAVREPPLPAVGEPHEPGPHDEVRVEADLYDEVQRLQAPPDLAAPDHAVLAALESWLGAIHADRDARAHPKSRIPNPK